MRPWRERLWDKIDVRGPDDCWLWTGVLSEGYGQLRVDGRMKLAHRLAYVDKVGPIPDGRLLRHTCESRYTPGDNTGRRCCNPAHLHPGTAADNSQDMLASGRAPRGVRNGQAKLTEQGARDIRAWYEVGGWTQRDLAGVFGVSQLAVWKIVRRVSWGHV